MRTLDRNRRVTVVPYQKSGVPEAAGLTVEDCRKAAWTFIPGGEPGKPRSRHRGAEAVNMSLAVALGTALPHRFYTLPLIRQAQDAAYEWVVRNRGKIPGDTPYCEQYPEECQ